MEISPLPFGPRWMVLGWEVICDPQGSVLVMVHALSFCTRMSDGEYDLRRLACFSSLVSNFVSKQCLFKEASDSSVAEFVFRLVEGQTLPTIRGFSNYISLVLCFYLGKSTG